MTIEMLTGREYVSGELAGLYLLDEGSRFRFLAKDGFTDDHEAVIEIGVDELAEAIRHASHGKWTLALADGRELTANRFSPTEGSHEANHHPL